MEQREQNFQVLPFPHIREAAIDLLREGQRKHMIHAFLEVDVTGARRIIWEHRAKSGERLSFTAFIVTCLARAIDEDRQVQAFRLGKRRLVIFENVDVNTMVERQVNGVVMGTPNIIRAANRMTYRQIHEEIRSAQSGKVDETKGMEWFKWAAIVGRLPRFVRTSAWRIVERNPLWIKEFAGTAGLTAVGMFGRGIGWGMTIPFLSPTVVLGGIVERPVWLAGKIEPRQFLCITVSVDHDIVDGAPAARFVARFREFIESSCGIQEELAP
jgi:pyruvate/2-oxoglutarate dehydrogenase complex dihydrolipoamide acyltransferase (E2) component